MNASIAPARIPGAKSGNVTCQNVCPGVAPKSRAAYAIYNPEARTWESRRVKYDIAAVQKRIRELGLPEKHAVRIGEGW